MTSVFIIESDCNGKRRTSKKRAVGYGSKYTISVGFQILGTHVVLESPALTTRRPLYTPFVYPRPPALAGGPNSVSKESPLSSVGVAGQDQVDGIGDERIILRMVREQDVIAGSGTVLFKPPCLRLMQRSMNRASDSLMLS